MYDVSNEMTKIALADVILTKTIGYIYIYIYSEIDQNIVGNCKVRRLGYLLPFIEPNVLGPRKKMTSRNNSRTALFSVYTMALRRVSVKTNNKRTKNPDLGLAPTKTNTLHLYPCTTKRYAHSHAPFLTSLTLIPTNVGEFWIMTLRKMPARSANYLLLC